MARAAREAAGIPTPARSSSKKNAKGYVTIDAPADYSPILYRGGRVIPTQPTPGFESYLSSSAMSRNTLRATSSSVAAAWAS